MKILAIDTSCDETACAVTAGTKVLSNIVWSQASLHAKFGGVMPSLAQRQHREHIGFVVDQATKISKLKIKNLDAIAVTIGPGLSIALGVGISKAKELAKKYNKPLIPINHVEANLLSPFANFKFHPFPAIGMVLSGGTTQLILIEQIGKYKILAETQDDALGEALDKAARMLGLGYPGGAILEKFAKNSNPKTYPLPVPLIDDKVKNRFSYSGLKTAFIRLVEKEKPLTKQKIYDLAASFQNTAFEHILRVLSYQVNHQSLTINHLLLGGGVANNIEIRNKLRKLCKEKGLKLHIPYSKKLCCDNAAMIGICAYLKTKDLKLNTFTDCSQIDREPRLKLV